MELLCVNLVLIGRIIIFQLYRSLRVPISSRMLSDILSRLVETVAEQGEDMQVRALKKAPTSKSWQIQSSAARFPSSFLFSF
jgi:hypothetical protein